MIPWLQEFPTLDEASLRTLKKAFDNGYRTFSRTYGDTIESFFDPLLYFLIWFERLLLAAPWWLVILVVAAVCWVAGRSRRLAVGVAAALFFIGYLGMWEDTMRTLAIIFVSTLIAIAIGIPVGIWMSRSDRVQAFITPILDIMQTMPIFVYLIPVVMLFGLGKIPGLIAVVIYAVPPVIRLTNLGIRLVDKEVLEAADAFGTDTWRRLFDIQMPLALPNIMAGVNQTIMMALSMVVIASMIGVKGLGQPVLQAVTNQYFALGLFNGAAVVALAIVFDRITQSYGRRIQSGRQS
ncbi:MAG: proline/glycine betaine ABC transporter permease [Deltaproteobacteria bacterium]|nr:proline/glycine betaine ABC transporter permease [Deltaproteobacteria bacterium]